MLVCIGGGDWVGPALCRLCPDIHSHTLYSGGKRDAPGAPSTQIKEGCATPLWAHLRDYQRENATSPVLGGGPGCNCVLSDLQSPPHSFVPDIFLHWIYFSLFGVLAAAPLVTKFSSFLPPCAPRANDRKCVQIALCMKRERYPHQEKVTRSNWWTGARDFSFFSLWFIGLNATRCTTFFGKNRNCHRILNTSVWKRKVIPVIHLHAGLHIP